MYRPYLSSHPAESAFPAPIPSVVGRVTVSKVFPQTVFLLICCRMSLILTKQHSIHRVCPRGQLGMPHESRTKLPRAQLGLLKLIHTTQVAGHRTAKDQHLHSEGFTSLFIFPRMSKLTDSTKRQSQLHCDCFANKN